jgi:hypothetical protein
VKLSYLIESELAKFTRIFRKVNQMGEWGCPSGKFMLKRVARAKKTVMFRPGCQVDGKEKARPGGGAFSAA